MSNIIISGMDAVGKDYLIDKLLKKYLNYKTINSTSKTRNDFYYHLDLLEQQENTIFNRFHTGEVVFPFIKTERYEGRVPKITWEEFDYLTQRIFDQGDLYIIMYSSDLDIIVKRLKERGENDYIEEIKQQQELYRNVIARVNKFNNKYFYACDIAQPDAYNLLDDWIDRNINNINVDKAYRNVCRDLLHKGHEMETKNLRGGTKELCNYMFTITDLDSEYVTLKTGKSSLTYLAAELLWYWSSRNDVEFISKFGSMWSKISDDGKTNNSAYGYLLQEKHGFNQIEKIIELLTVDPYSRRAVININVPNENVIETKDEPCTVCLDYQIRNGKLHCTCVMRSNDINFGLRNDLGFFIYLQKYIAKRLNVPVGAYTHFAMSIHFYNRDTNFVKGIAYGTLEREKEVLDIEKLIENKEHLINWVDNEFTSKNDFLEILRDLKIVYER